MRAASAAVLLLGGIAIAAAIWVNGDHRWAVGVLAGYLVLAGLAYLVAGGSNDWAAALRAGGDERQRGLDRDATAITGLVLVGVAIVGAVISIGRTGDPGVYGEFCVIGGVVYTAAFWALHRRR